MRASHPLALLATATAAVHHPGITGTSFGGSRRNHGPPRTGMVKPNLAIRRGLGRRIRLTGLLREKPWKRGFFYVCCFAGDSSGWPPRQARRRFHGTARRGRPAGLEGRTGYEPLRSRRLTRPEVSALKAGSNSRKVREILTTANVGLSELHQVVLPAGGSDLPHEARRTAGGHDDCSVDSVSRRSGATVER